MSILPLEQGGVRLSEAILPGERRARLGVRQRQRLPVAIWLLSMILVVIGIAILFVTRDVELPPSWGIRGFPVIFALATATLGTLIVARRPDHRIGWILLIAGLSAAALFFASEYAIYGLAGHPGALPGGVYAAWFASWIWVVFAFLVGPLFLLLFPEGHLKSRRWRPLLWLSLASMALLVVVLMLFPGPLENYAFAENPFGLPALDRIEPLQPFALAFMGASFVGAALSLALRLREAEGDERQQIKWVAFAGGVVAVAAVLGPFGKPFEILLIVAFTTVPLAAAVAILRYRLYDIDLLINRTIVYGSLTAILAGVYTASITLSTRVFQSATGERSDAAIVLTTLIVVSFFTPLKNRVQAIVDRRFKDAHEPARILGAFVDRLREGPWQIDPERVRSRLASEAEVAFDAVGAAIYLRAGGEERLAFATERWVDDAALRVPLGRSGPAQVELRLGPRREGRVYLPADADALRATVDQIAQLTTPA